MRHLLVVPALLVATALPAQTGGRLAYRRTPGDTVRYRLTQQLAQQRTLAQGPLDTRTTSSIEFSYAFGPGDSARAWFDTLAITSAGPQGSITLPVAELQRKPFVLTLDAHGRGHVVGSPEMSESGKRWLGFGDQFEALLPRLPDRDVKSGDTWTDTTREKSKSRTGGDRQLDAVTTYRVLGENTIEGRRLLFVEMKAHTKSLADGEINGERVRSTMEGDASGTFQFAPDEGKVVRVERHSDQRGRTQGASIAFDEHAVSDFTMVLEP